MGIFMVQLVKTLNQERPDWRKDTIILHDNAPYFKSVKMRRTLESLDIPMLFTGQHSYAAVPIELWFAAFKRDDINPRHIPTGKK